MIEDHKLRHDMIYLLGQLDALAFPLIGDSTDLNVLAYYDLIDSIRAQYESILKRTIGWNDD